MILSSRTKLGTLLGRQWKTSLFMAAYSLAFVTLYEAGYEGVAIPIGIATMLGTALSILLGFRTSSAYDRWWEARKIWGGIVNDSRSLARQVLTLYSAEEFKRHDLRGLQERMVYRQIGWCRALNKTLRGASPLPELQGLVEDAEREALQGQQNVHAALLHSQGVDAQRARQENFVEPWLGLAVEETLVRFSDHMGKCERIKSTHFSAPYAFVVSRALWLFFLLLPAGLAAHLSWIAIPVSVVVTAFFGLIHLIADYLQDPFENRASDTPMDAICRTIEINLRQALGEEDIPPKLEPVDGVLM